MRATELYNYRTERNENNESFAKRVYDTVKRFRKSMILIPSESWHIITLLSRYYKTDEYDILSVIKSLEDFEPSTKYRIQWVHVSSDRYLIVDKRNEIK